MRESIWNEIARRDVPHIVILFHIVPEHILKYWVMAPSEFLPDYYFWASADIYGTFNE